jgi:hypothetical protein
VPASFPGTALVQAIQAKQPEIAERLVRNFDADVNLQGTQAYSKNGSGESLAVFGWSPIHWAVYQHDLKTLMLLVENEERIADLQHSEGRSVKRMTCCS